MAYDIGPRIGIEGEAEFRQAINALNTSFKTLGTEMATVTSQFDKNDKSSKSLTAQNGVLNKQIDTQRQKLEQLNSGLAQSITKYGAADKVTQGWQQAVNKATAELNKMDRALAENNKSIALQDSNWTKMGKSFDTIGKKMKTLGEELKGVGEKLSMRLTAPILATGVDSAKLASDLAENMNKVDVAFGKNSGEVKSWSDTTLKSFGISKGSALEMSSLFGDMGTAMGQSTAEASKMSTGLVGLAGDLASFKNIGIDQAQDALKGIFTGEGESLKSLGIIMQDSTLIAYAQATGQKKAYSEMTQAEKVALRYAFVMNATKNSQGDFARTSEGTANQTRIFGETLKELGANMGQYILPVVTPLIAKLSEMAKAFGDLSPATQKTILVIAGIVAVVGPALVVIGSIITAVGAIAGAFAAASTAIAAAGGIIAFVVGIITSPITITIAAIAALAAIAFVVVKNWEPIKVFFGNLWTSITATTSAAWEGIKQFFSDTWTAITSSVVSAWEGLKSAVSNGLNAILNFIQPALNFYQTIFMNTWDIIKNIVLGAVLIVIDIVTGNFTKLGSDIGSIWNNIKTALINIWEAIKGVAVNAWNGLKDGVISITSSIRDGVFSVWNSILNFFRNLPGTLYSLGSSAFNSLKSGISSVLNTIGGIVSSGFNGAINFLTGLPGRAYGWGKDFIQGLINGIGNMINSVKNAAGGVGTAIRKILGFSVPEEGPLSAYESWMPDFMSGLAKGIEANKFKVTQAIQGLSTDMTMGVKYNALPNATGISQDMVLKTAQEVARNVMGNNQRPTVINFNGSYAFNNQNDIDYFMNKSAVLIQRRS